MDGVPVYMDMITADKVQNYIEPYFIKKSETKEFAKCYFVSRDGQWMLIWVNDKLEYRHIPTGFSKFSEGFVITEAFVYKDEGRYLFAKVGYKDTKFNLEISILEFDEVEGINKENIADLFGKRKIYKQQIENSKFEKFRIQTISSEKETYVMVSMDNQRSHEIEFIPFRLENSEIKFDNSKNFRQKFEYRVFDFYTQVIEDHVVVVALVSNNNKLFIHIGKPPCATCPYKEVHSGFWSI